MAVNQAEIVSGSRSTDAATDIRTTVFISYSRKDIAFAQTLVEELNSSDYRAYLDKKDILPGEPWQSRLGQLILEADTIVFVVTPSSIASEVCAWEVAEAERLSKRVLPVVRERVDVARVPAGLARLNFLFMTPDRSFAEAVGELHEALTVDIQWIREHTRIGMLAEGWRARGRPQSEILRGDALAASETWLRLTPVTLSQPTEVHVEYIHASRSEYDREENEKKTAIDNFMISQSRFLAEMAIQQTKAGDAVTGALLALEGLPQESDAAPRPYVAAAEFALINAYFQFREQIVTAFDAPISGLSLHPGDELVAVALHDSTVHVRVLSNKGEGVVLRGHPDSVNSVKFSASGKRLLSTSDDGSCIVWDVPSMRLLNVLKGKDSCDDAFVSADDAVIVARHGSTVIVWNAETGRQAACWSVSNDSTYAFDVTSTCSHAVSGSGRFATDLLDRERDGDNTARVWDVRTGKKIAELAEFRQGILSARFDPIDANRVVVTSVDGTARIWDWTSADRALKLKGHEHRIFSGEWRMDGNQVITASEDKTARIWSAKTGKRVVTLEGHEHFVRNAAFMPDGSYALTTSNDGTARLWDCKTGAVTTVLRGHVQSVSASAVTRSGALLLTASSAERTMRLWSVSGTNAGRTLNWPDSEATGRHLTFSPDGRRLLVVTSERAHLWNPWNGAEISQIERTDDEDWYVENNEVAFDADSSQFFIRYDQAVVTYDAANGERRGVFDHGKESIEGAAFNPHGRHLLTMSDSMVRCWDSRDGQLIRSLTMPEQIDSEITSESFSFDGRYFVTILDDDKAYIWSIDTGEQIGVIGTNRHRIRCAVFHPFDNILITAGSSGIHVWTCDGTRVRKIARKDRNWSVKELRFSPNGKILLAKCNWDDDDKLVLWDFLSNKNLGEIGDAALDNEIAIFSADCNQFFTTFYAQISMYGSPRHARATLRTLDNLDRDTMLADAGDVVRAAQFDPKTRFLALGLDDGGTRLMDARSGEQVAVLRGDGSSVQDVAFSPDGRLLVSLSYGGVTIWPMFDSTSAVIAEVKKAIPRALTVKQRTSFFLPTEPPDWCIESSKWPFHGAKWKRWLAKRRSGLSPDLPKQDF